MNRVTSGGLSTPQRRLGALGIFATACAAMFVGAGAVYADTTADATASSTTSAPAPGAYPPAESCALQGQPSSVIPGATVTITGVAASNTSVSAVLSPEASTVGTALSDGSGNYSIAAAVPITAANGDTITVGGVTCATVTVTTPAPPVGSEAVSPIIATPTVSSSLAATSASNTPSKTVTVAPTKAVQVAQVHSSKPLAFTGASVLVPGVLGLVFIGGGLILFVLGRRGKAGQN